MSFSLGVVSRFFTTSGVLMIGFFEGLSLFNNLFSYNFESCFCRFLGYFFNYEMPNDWKPFNDFHDPYSFGSSLDIASFRYTCVALHAAMFIFINFICAVLLYIIYCIDYRYFSIGFSLYMASWHGYNLFAFRFFGSNEIFTFEYWP